LAVAAFVLAYWGFSVCPDCNVQGPVAITLKSFALVKGGTNYSHPWQLLVAQWFVPLVALLGFAKLLVSRIRRDVRLALVKRARNHVIVCGLGDTGKEVALAQHAAGRKVVVIDQDNESVAAHSLELAGVPVLKGDAADPQVLAVAGLAKSSALVICCGSDAVNLEVSLHARDALSKKKGVVPLRTYCEVREQWLLRQIAGSTATLSSKTMEFVAVNFYENAARELLNKLATKRKLLSEGTPHILIVGFGTMGLEILVQCVRSYFAIPGQRVVATIVDQNADAARGLLVSSIPSLASLADITFIGHNFGAGDDCGFLDDAIRAQTPDIVFVATQSDELNLRIGMTLRERLDKARQYATPIYVRDQAQPNLGHLISSIHSAKIAIDRLVAFAGGGLMSGADALAHDPLDDLARAAHLVYASREGSTAATPWEHLPERMKRSNRFFADHIAVKLARFGFEIVRAHETAVFTDAEVEELARMEHWRWCTEQKLDGWEYGAVRDDQIKHHPLLVDWDALPNDARHTNRALVRSIPQILAAAGLGIRRNKVVGSADTAASDKNVRRVVLASAGDTLAPSSAVQHVWLRIAEGMAPAEMMARQAALGPAFDAWVDQRATLPDS
jgi:Trk K+ transport system NAD-binding subunit